MMDFDVIVIGAGPAGMFAAIYASDFANVCILERNSVLGKKLSISGSGRCNLASSVDGQDFLARFGERGRFLKPSLYVMPFAKIEAFFSERGLPLKEEGERVFPVSERAGDVVSVLNNELLRKGVSVFTDAFVRDISLSGSGGFVLQTSQGRFDSKAVVLATGGATYSNTGSDGNGYRLAIRSGHSITRLVPALSALKCAQDTSLLKGITLKDVVVRYGKKRARGAVIFTHFGISGPVIHNICADVLEKNIRTIYLDLLPDLGEDELFSGMSQEGSKRPANRLKRFLPKNLARYVEKSASANLKVMAGVAKSLPLTVIGSLPFDYAMATRGGVVLNEVYAKTLMSKKVPGLFFAGEILDIDGPTGGYNIEAAICMGVNAGRFAGMFAGGVVDG